MTACCGYDLIAFDGFSEGYRMYGKLYIPLGYHHIENRAFICCEEIQTGERVDVLLSSFYVDVDTGLFDLLTDMQVIAEAAK